jgi:hypothetical protein
VRRLNFIAVIIAAFASLAYAKCGNTLIVVEGYVEGTNSALQQNIAVRVDPDPNWDDQPAVRFEDGKLEAKVWFDMTKSEGVVRDNCSRKPRTVTVSLIVDGRETEAVSLIVRRDFIRVDTHHYNLKSPLVLHSR